MTSPAPLLSLIIPARRRDDPALARLLASLKRQSFQDFEALVITQGNSEEAKAIGIGEARGTLLGFFCTDNDFRDPDFLRTMVWHALLPGVTGAYTAQYDYVTYDAPLSRYFALLGANDPVCWWLGKADRASYLRGAHGPLGPTTRLVRYPRALPSVGDNGCLLKAALVKRHVTLDPARFGSCMDMCEDLRRAGHSTYAVVTEQKLWHRTGEGWTDYVRRRWRYVNDLYWDRLPTRRWVMVGTLQDWLLVVCFAVASLLVVPQLAVALVGYYRVRDVAWWLHPLVCLVLTGLYTLAWLTSWCRWLFPRTVVPSPSGGA